MRVPKRKPDFGTISRESIKKDFQLQKQPDSPAKDELVRIAYIHEKCEYARFARFFINKAMRCTDSYGKGTTTGWYEFIYDADRVALNKAAGRSDAKTRYFLERPKFK